MTDEPLPKQADLRKLATKQARFSVHMKAADFPRFAEAVIDAKGSVEADLQFDVDEQRVRHINGHLSSNVAVICQRCMQPVDINIHSAFLLGIAWDEEHAKKLPKTMDTIIVEDGELVDLSEVLEDELLLAMPFVSYHELDQCSAKQDYVASDDDYTEASTEEKENPFSVLEQLKFSKD